MAVYIWAILLHWPKGNLLSDISVRKERNVCIHLVCIVLVCQLKPVLTKLKEKWLLLDTHPVSLKIPQNLNQKSKKILLSFWTSPKERKVKQPLRPEQPNINGKL